MKEKIDVDDKDVFILQTIKKMIFFIVCTLCFVSFSFALFLHLLVHMRTIQHISRLHAIAIQVYLRRLEEVLG